jgi:hypothetical protein
LSGIAGITALSMGVAKDGAATERAETPVRHHS